MKTTWMFFDAASAVAEAGWFALVELDEDVDALPEAHPVPTRASTASATPIRHIRCMEGSGFIVALRIANANRWDQCSMASTADKHLAISVGWDRQGLKMTSPR